MRERGVQSKVIGPEVKNEGGDSGDLEAGVEMGFTVNEGNAISFSKCLDVLARVGGAGEERWVRPRSAALAPEKELEWKKQTEVRRKYWVCIAVGKGLQGDL